MPLTNLSIVYDLQPPIYFPGKPISGKIGFLITDPLPFDYVRVECYGSVDTKRTKTATSTNGFAKNIIYSAHEIYCDQSKSILEATKRHSISDGPMSQSSDRPEDTEKSVTIARKTSALKPASTSVIKPGTYSFPFNFYLPLKCPSSFEGSYGHVRYFCKVTIGCSGSDRLLGKMPFTVIGWSDLNYSPTAGTYYQTEAHSSTDEKGGKMLARLYLRQQGYVPGEMINARMEIVNNCTKSISTIFAQFVQKVTYAAKKQQSDDWSKWEERRVMQQIIRKEKVASKKSSLLKWEVFAIPPCCPTMLIDTNILRIQYELQFNFVFDGGQAPSLILTAPIIIGAIPLKHSFDELRTIRLRQSDGTIHGGQYLPLMERYSDIPIPVFVPQSLDRIDIREPSDLIYLTEPIQFSPMAVLYDSTKPSIEPAEKRSSRKQSKNVDSTRPRSRTLSRFSFRGSTDSLSLAASPKENVVVETPPTSTPKKPDDSTSTSKSNKKKEKEIKEPTKERSSIFGRRKTVSAGTNEKSKKDEQKKTTVEHKGTQEPPVVENGTSMDPEISGGEEEFF